MPRVIVRPYREQDGFHLDRFTTDYLAKPTREPVYRTARAWIEAGHDPNLMLRFYREGKRHTQASGVASELAKWSVEELKSGRMRRAKYREFKGLAND